MNTLDKAMEFLIRASQETTLEARLVALHMDHDTYRDFVREMQQLAVVHDTTQRGYTWAGLKLVGHHPSLTDVPTDPLPRLPFLMSLEVQRKGWLTEYHHHPETDRSWI